LETYTKNAADAAAQPAYRRVKALLATAQQALDDRLAELKKCVPNEARLRARAATEPLATRIAVLREVEKELVADIARLEDKLGSGGGDELSHKIERLEGEVRQLRTTIDELKELLKKGQNGK
jgi:hypothetical protein